MIGKQQYLCYSLLAILVAGGLSAQPAIFEERFHNGVSDRGVGAIDWYGHQASGLLLAQYSSPGTGDATGTTAQGWFQNANAPGPTSPSDVNGFLLFIPESAAARQYTLAWTEFTFDPAGYTDIDFQFSLRNSNTTASTRLAIQVDGNWYASNTSFTAGTALTWEAKSFDFTVDAAEWRGLTFDGTTTTDSTVGLSLAASVLDNDLPSGSITALGFFFHHEGISGGGQNVRIDNFSVNGTAIPEPSTYALLGGLTAFGFMLLRRRRK